MPAVLVIAIEVQYPAARALSIWIFAPRGSRPGGLRGREVWGVGRRGERAPGMGTQVRCVALRLEVAGGVRRAMTRRAAWACGLARATVGPVRSPAAV